MEIKWQMLLKIITQKTGVVCSAFHVRKQTMWSVNYQCVYFYRYFNFKHELQLKINRIIIIYTTRLMRQTVLLYVEGIVSICLYNFSEIYAQRNSVCPQVYRYHLNFIVFDSFFIFLSILITLASLQLFIQWVIIQ